jgi:hypothetical protein
MRFVTLSIAATLAATSGAALAAGSSPAPNYTLTTTTYSQNFDTLASSGTSQSLPAGFQIAEGDTGGAADGFYAAGTGSSNAGNTYSFGTTVADRALGSLTSGSVTPTWFGVIFTNGLGSTITGLTFTYDGEQWRAGTAASDVLNFQYSLDATEVNNGTWTDINSLDFAALILAGNTALDGNLAANRSNLSGSVSGLSIAQGQKFGFRWVDVDVTGSDHGLAIDNFRLSATLAQTAAVPEPGTWAMMILGFGVVGASLRRRRVLAFA